MEECLHGLHTKICFVYIDDIIVFAPEFDEHLEQVLDRLRSHGLKLSPDKCSLFKPKVTYVGHVVSEEGIEPDPAKIERVIQWPRPETPEDVRKFLGFVGYYRRFIRNFSRIAKPLTILMPAPKKPKKVNKRKATEKPEPCKWIWEDEQEDAFNKLKCSLTQPPILGYPDFGKPFFLHTDASGFGLGAVLYQEQDDLKRVIAYASRGLSRSEQRYPAHKLEFLALKWAVTEKFSDYLYGNQFTAVTDNNPLTYVLTSAKLDATSQRWVAALAAYDFDIVYRPGINNTDADSMSRLPSLTSEIEDGQTIPREVIRALGYALQPKPLIENVTMSADVLKDINWDTNSKDTLNVAVEQEKDPDLSIWIPFVKAGTKPRKEDLPLSRVQTNLRTNFDKLFLDGGILYRRIIVDGSARKQLVLPKSLVPTALTMVHDKMGHLGRDRVISFLQDRFYWPGMTRDAEEWIKMCGPCTLRKTPAKGCAPLVSIPSSQPLELICMDFLCLETSKGGYNNVLVITDHYTKYAIAVPTKNSTAKTTADAFFNNFVVHYGLPTRIHTDQGPNFESQLLKELCVITGIAKSHTTPYHPMGNGLCERFNRTLLSMLGTLESEQKKNWKAHLSALVHAYNCTRQDSTGQSPYYLMFGRNPRLPVDLAFGIDIGQNFQDLTAYVDELRKRLQRAYEIASANVSKSQTRQKGQYDKKVRGTTVKVGDRVLVKIVHFDGRHKLSNKWESDPYTVVDQPDQNIPIFVVRKENGDGRDKTLHRNLLLPINFISGLEEKPVPVPRTRKMRLRSTRKSHDSSESSSESEDDVLVGNGVLPNTTAGTTNSSSDEMSVDADDARVEAVLEENGSDADDDAGLENDREAHVANHQSDADDGDDTVTETQDDEDPNVVQPRPRRRREAPAWQRSGDFILSQQQQPEWMTVHDI